MIWKHQIYLTARTDALLPVFRIFQSFRKSPKSGFSEEYFSEQNFQNIFQNLCQNLFQKSIGDDDQMEQLHELRDSWLNEWDSARMGRVYLSTRNLHAKRS